VTILETEDIWEKGACVAIHRPASVPKRKLSIVELQEALVDVFNKNPAALGVAAIGGVALMSQLSPELLRRLAMPLWVPTSLGPDRGGKRP
jgi:hypothetical protein